MATRPGQDPMARNIRENLQRVASTSGKYFQGTAKMFLASTKDLAKNSLPTIGSMYDANKDLITDVTRFLKNPGDALHRAADTAMTSENYQTLLKLKDYAIEDLKSGNFYDPNRDRTEFGQDTADLLENFGDFDMSGFNSDGDYDDGDLFDIKAFEKEIALQEHHEKASDARTMATIDVIQKVGQASVRTSQANAQMDARLGIKQHSQIMSSMENLITQQGAILTAVNQTATSMLEVSRETHREVMEGLSNITELLTTIASNIVKPTADVELQEDDDDIFGVHGELNVRKWLKKAGKQTMDKYQISTMLGMAGGFDFKTLAESVMSNPLQMISDAIVKNVLPNYLKKTIETTNAYMENFFPTLMNKLADRGKKFDMDTSAGRQGKLTDMIAGMFGVQEKKGGWIDLRPQGVTEAAGLSKKTVKAIEEVIPMWLSKIYSAVSGDDLSMYNYVTGKMESVSKKIADTQYDVGNLVARMGEAAREFSDRATSSKIFAWEDEKMKKEFEDYVFKYLQKAGENGTFINPWKEDELFNSELPEHAQKELFGRILKSVGLHMPRNQLMKMNSEIMGARRDQQRANRQTEKDLQESGLSMLFEMVPEDLRYQLESATMEHRYGLDDDKIKKVVSGYNKQVRNSGEKIGTAATNQYLDDISSMLRRGIVVYPTYEVPVEVKKRRGKVQDIGLYEDPNRIRAQALSDAQAEGDAVIRRRNRQKYLKNLEIEDIEDKNRKSREKQLSANRDGLIWINEDTDLTSLNIAQGEYAARITRDRESDSAMVEEQRYAKMTEEQKKEYRNKQLALKRRNMIQEHLAKRATGVADKLGIGRPLSSEDSIDANMTFGQRLWKAKDTPFKMLDLGLRTVDQFMFKLLYGEDAANIPAGEDGDPEAYSLMRVVTESVQAHWKNATTWFSENIGKPIKDFFFGTDGLFPRIRRRGSELFQQYINPKIDAAKTRLLGSKVEDGTYSGGIFSNALNKAGGMKDGLVGLAKNKFRDAKNKFLYGSSDTDSVNVRNRGRIERTYEDRNGLISQRYNKDTGKMEYVYKNADGTKETLDRMRTKVAIEYQGMMGQMKKGFDDFKEMMFGPDDKGDDHGSKAKFNLVTGELKKAFPDMTIGAGVGILGSLFLPGGPLLGAMLGSVGGIVTGSEKFKEFLFGKPKKKIKQKYNIKTGMMEDVEYDSYDDTGIFSSQVIDGVKQYFPGMAGGAAIGKLVGGGIMPGIMGQAIGTVAGSVIGMVASSDKLKQIIFGDAAKGDDDGIISKRMREGIAQMFTEHAPGVIAGGLTGAKVGAMIGKGIGLIPGLAIMGPISTVMGGMVGAIGGDALQTIFFGETKEVEEPDPDHPGKTIKVKKKVGGLFGKAFDYARDSIFKPFGEKVNQMGDNVSHWFDESVIGPLQRSMKPVHDSMERAKNAIHDTFINIGTNIKESLDRTFENAFGKSLHDFFEEKVMGPLKRMTNNIFSGIGKAIGAVLSAPFKAVEFIFTGKIGGAVPEDDDKSKGKNQKGKKAPKDKKGLFSTVAGDKEKSAGFFSKVKESMAQARDKAKEGQSTQSIQEWFRNQKLDRDARKAQRDMEKDQAAKAKAAAKEEGTAKRNALMESIAEKKRALEEKTKARKESVAALKAQRAEEREKRKKERDEIKAKANPTLAESLNSTQGMTIPQTGAQVPTIGTIQNQQTPVPGAPKVPNSGQYHQNTVTPPVIQTVTTQQPTEATATSAAQSTDIQNAQGKTVLDYSRSIDRNVAGIYDEIKGQLGNTGWNLGYIKTILDKKFGKLRSDELPEEMEGSTRKNVTKRKGLFGKIGSGLGRIGSGAIGLASKGVSGLFDGVGSLLNGAVNIIFSPIKMLGGALQGLGNAVGSLTKTIVQTAATLVGSVVKTIGTVAAGAANVLSNVLVGAAKVVTSTAAGLGSALGNILGTLTGVLKDMTLAISGTVAGMVKTIGAIVPEVVGPIVKGMATVGKTILGGVWGGIKTVGKGVGWILSNTIGRLFGMGGSGKGGKKYFDANSLIPVGVGGVENKIAYPFVTVKNGRALFTFSDKAIPVYLVGAEKDAKVTTVNKDVSDLYDLASDAGSIYVHDQAVHNKLNRIMEHYKIDTTGTGPHDNIEGLRVGRKSDDENEQLVTEISDNLESTLNDYVKENTLNILTPTQSTPGIPEGLTFSFTDNDALVVHIDSLSNDAINQFSGKDTKNKPTTVGDMWRNWWDRENFQGAYYRGFTLNPIERFKRSQKTRLAPQVVDIPRMNFKENSLMVYVNGVNPAVMRVMSGDNESLDPREGVKRIRKRNLFNFWKSEDYFWSEAYDASGERIYGKKKGLFDGKGPLARRYNRQHETPTITARPQVVSISGLKMRGDAATVYLADMDPRLVYMLRGQMKPEHLISETGALAGPAAPGNADPTPAKSKDKNKSEGGKKKRRSLKEFLHDKKEEFLDFLGPIGSVFRFAGGMAGGAVNPIKDYLKNTIWDDGLKKIGSAASNVGSSITNSKAVTGAKAKINSFREDIPGNIKAGMGNLKDNLHQKYLDASATAGIYGGIIQEGVKQRVKRTGENIKQAAANAPQQIADWKYRTGNKIQSGIAGVKDDLIEAQMRAGAGASLAKSKLKSVFGPKELEDPNTPIELTLNPNADPNVDYNKIILRNMQKMAGTGGIGFRIASGEINPGATIKGAFSTAKKNATIAYKGYQLNKMMDDIAMQEIYRQKDAATTAASTITDMVGDKLSDEAIINQALGGNDKRSTVSLKQIGSNIKGLFTRENFKNVGHQAVEQIQHIDRDAAVDVANAVIADKLKIKNISLPHNKKEAASIGGTIKSLLSDIADSFDNGEESPSTTNTAGEDKGPTEKEYLDEDIKKRLKEGTGVPSVPSDSGIGQLVFNGLSALTIMINGNPIVNEITDTVGGASGYGPGHKGKKRSNRSGTNNPMDKVATAVGVGAAMSKGVQDERRKLEEKAKIEADNAKSAENQRLKEFQEGFKAANDAEARADNPEEATAEINKTVGEAKSEAAAQGATEAAKTNQGSGGGGGGGSSGGTKEKKTTGLMESLGKIGSGLFGTLFGGGSDIGFNLGTLGGLVVPFLLGTLGTQKGLIGKIGSLPIVGDWLRQKGFDTSSKATSIAEGITESKGHKDWVKQRAFLGGARGWKNAFTFADAIETNGLTSAIKTNNKTGTLTQKIKGGVIAGIDNAANSFRNGLAMNMDDTATTLAGNNSKLATKIGNLGKAIGIGNRAGDLAMEGIDTSMDFLADKAAGGSKSQKLIAKASKAATVGLNKAKNKLDTSKIMQTIKEAVEKLMSNPTVKKLFGKVADKIGPVTSKIVEIIKSKLMPKLASEGGKMTLASTGKAIATFMTGGVFIAAMAVKDFIVGYNDASKYFDAYGSELTLSMKLTSGVVSAIGSLLSSMPGPIGAILGMIVSVLQEPLVKGIFQLLSSDEEKKSLAEAQEKTQADVDKYNKEHGTDYTVDEYVSEFKEDGKRGLFSSIGHALGIKSDYEKRKAKEKKEADKAAGKTKPGFFDKVKSFFGGGSNTEESGNTADANVVINVNSPGTPDVSVDSQNAETTEVGKGDGTVDMSSVTNMNKQIDALIPKLETVNDQLTKTTDSNIGEFGTGAKVAVVSNAVKNIAGKAGKAMLKGAMVANPILGMLAPVAGNFIANNVVNQNEGWAANAKTRGVAGVLGSTINALKGNEQKGFLKNFGMAGNLIAGGIKGAKTALVGGKASGNIAIEKLIAEAVNKLFGNKTVRKLFGKLAPKMSKIAGVLKNFLSKKALSKATQTAGKNILKSVGGLLTGGMLNIVFAVKDFISGFMNANKFFPDATEITLGMKLTSAIVNTAGGLVSAIPGVGPMLSAAVSLLQPQLVKEIWDIIKSDDVPDDEINQEEALASASDTVGNMTGTEMVGTRAIPITGTLGRGNKSVSPNDPVLKAIADNNAIGEFGTGPATFASVTDSADKEQMFKAMGEGIGNKIVAQATKDLPGGKKDFAQVFGKMGGGIGDSMLADMRELNKNKDMGTIMVEGLEKIMNKIFLGEDNPSAASIKQNGFFNKIKDGIGNVFSNIKTGLGNAMDSAISWIKEAGGKIVDWWNGSTEAPPETTAETTVGDVTTEPTASTDNLTRANTALSELADLEKQYVGNTAVLDKLKGIRQTYDRSNHTEADVEKLVTAVNNIKSGNTTSTGITQFEITIAENKLNDLLNINKDNPTATANLKGILETYRRSQHTDTDKSKFIQAVNNFRVIGDTVHSPGTVPTNQTGMTGTERMGRGRWGTGVKPMDQTAARYNQGNKLMAKVGCGPTVAAMVGSAYGDKSANPLEANQKSISAGMRASDGGTNPDFFKQYAAGKNYGMNKGPVDATAIAGNLNKGQPVVMMGKGGAYGKNMHYMVADKLSGKGNVSVVDPIGGARKNVSMSDLTNNASQAVYSYGKGRWGTGAIVNSGIGGGGSSGGTKSADAEKNRELQQALVDKMASINGTIQYSLGGVQDPDKGKASCASTVAWAYNKVLGFRPGNGNFASSTGQSTDDRFTTIYAKQSSDDRIPIDIMQPGDIIYYKWGSYNSSYPDNLRKYDHPVGHTEMYAGNGEVWNHGTSKYLGPVKKKINGGGGEYDRKRDAMLVRRYSPFLNGEHVDPALGAFDNAGANANTGTYSGGNSGGNASNPISGYTGGTDFLGWLTDAIGSIGTKLGNVLSSLLGMGVSEEETNSDGSTSPKTDTKNDSNRDTGSNSGTNSGGSIPQLVPGTETTATIWNYLRGKGFSKEATSGIMGNLQAESGMQPRNIQNYTYDSALAKSKGLQAEDEKYLSDVLTGKHDFVHDSKGWGLAQWTYWSRKQALQDLAKQQGKTVGDLDPQLEHLWRELNSYGVVDSLNGVKSVRDASDIILHQFEKPADQSRAVEEARAAYGQTWYDKYANAEVKDGQVSTEDPKEKKKVPHGAKSILDLNEDTDLGMGSGWGTGPETLGVSANLQSLNNSVAQINKLMKETQKKASEESTVKVVTEKITDAITGSQGGTSDKALAAVAESLAQVVELLAKIEKNTQKTDEVDGSHSKGTGPRTLSIPNAPFTAANGRENPDNVGLSIIDKLTANIR